MKFPVMRLSMLCFSVLCFFFFFEKTLGGKLFLKRKYPNVENGVYQLDTRGAPIKVVDVNYGHKWIIPPNEKGVNAYAVVNEKGKIKKFSEGTNLIYGTTKRIRQKNKEEKEIDEKEIKKEIEINKKKGIIKNVSDVTKTEEINKKNKPVIPKAMHIESENITEEKKQQTEEDIDIGKTMGVAIKKNIEQHYSESTNPSPLSTEIIDSKIPDSLEKLLLEDMEERKWLSKKPVNDKMCLRDYSVQCPSAWDKISDTQCRAPKEYSGPCAHVMVFEPMTAKEKSQLAVDCNVNWLCINESCGNDERDYSKECPENWMYRGKCEAPENYSGECDKIMDFDDFTESEKESFSSTCKVVWPCKTESCERDYSITCPKGWSYDVNKDLCKAPSNLEVLFSKEEIDAISTMTYNQHMAFSSKYGIAWPCKNNCTYNYDKYACPRGWIDLMNSGVCKAPDDYVAPFGCPVITHFDYMNVNEKENFSKKCNVKWLCIENAERDYTKCPIYFEYIESGIDKGKCKPTDKYKGPCKETQDILSLKLEQKFQFEENCECQFPNLKKEDIYQTDEEIISKEKLEKLLKGTDPANRGVTLE